MASNFSVQLSSGRVPLQLEELCGVKQSELDGIAAFMESKMPSFSDGQACSLSELHSQYLEACASAGTPHLPLDSFKLVLVNAFQSHVQVIADASNTLQIVLLKTLNVIAELNELAFLRKAVRNSETNLKKCPLSSTLSSLHPSAVLLHKLLEEINSSQSELVYAPQFNGGDKFTQKKHLRGSQKLNNTVNYTKNVGNGSFAYKGLCIAYESLCNFLHVLIKGCCPEDNQEFMDSALFGEIARLVEELARLQILHRQPPKAGPQSASGVAVIYNGSKHTLPPVPHDVSVEHLHRIIKTRLRLAKDSDLRVSFHDASLNKNVPLNSENIKCAHGKTLLVEMSGGDSIHGKCLLEETTEAITCHEMPFEANVQPGVMVEKNQNTSVNGRDDGDNNNGHTQCLHHVNDRDDNGRTQSLHHVNDCNDDGHTQSLHHVNDCNGNGHTQSLNHWSSSDGMEDSNVAAWQSEEVSHHASVSGAVDEGRQGDKVDGQPCCSATEKQRPPGTTPPPHLPLDAFPRPLVARICRQEPLLRGELCQVTSAVFRHVVPAVPYPTRNQYCEITKALFRTLPGLLNYSSSYEDALSEWKYRLSHKFRNCRRKNKRTSKRPRPTEAYGTEAYGCLRPPCIATPETNDVIKAVLLHKHKRHNLTLNMEEPLSLDSLLGLIHRQLDIPQYVALRVLLQDGGHLTPVTQHNVQLVRGKPLVVEVDDNIDISPIPVDADILRQEDGRNESLEQHDRDHEIDDNIDFPQIPVDAILRHEDGRNVSLKQHDGDHEIDDNIDFPQIPVDAILRHEDGKNVSLEQHDGDLDSGRHLSVEIDDNIDGNIDQIPVDAVLSHENGHNAEVSVEFGSCHLPSIPINGAILRHEEGKHAEVSVKFEPCHLPPISVDAAILRHEEGNSGEVSVKFEPGLSEKENERIENELGEISISAAAHASVTNAPDLDALHSSCEPDPDLPKPSTRIEIEEDHVKNLKVEVNESEEIDLGETYLDFDAIESCGLVQQEVMNFKTEESHHLSSDHRHHFLHEIVFIEDLENKNVRPALKKRCRGAPLPPNFSVPLAVFPPLVTARVAHRLPLARSDVCRITSALFSYVVTRLPYPSPSQYSEIICALFAALPGLLSYSGCVEAAHSEWKYRLSHKFRNYRRKKKNNKSKSHPKRGRRTSFLDDGSPPTDEFLHGHAALWTNDSVFPFGSTNEEAACGGASPTCGLPSQ